MSSPQNGKTRCLAIHSNNSGRESHNLDLVFISLFNLHPRLKTSAGIEFIRDVPPIRSASAFRNKL